MVSISNIAGTILLLVLYFKYASHVPPISVEFWRHCASNGETSSIFCYDCNSAYDPRCGEEFDSFSLGIVNCSLRDPPEHINPVEPTFCRVIKMEIYGKVRIVRQCGFIEEEMGGHTCRRQTGNGDLFITYCTCDTDLCNTASALDYKLALLLTIAAMSFRVL